MSVGRVSDERGSCDGRQLHERRNMELCSSHSSCDTLISLLTAPLYLRGSISWSSYDCQCKCFELLCFQAIFIRPHHMHCIKVKVGFLYSAAYAMTGPARFTISEVAVDWQEPVVLQRKLRPSNCTR